MVREGVRVLLEGGMSRGSVAYLAVFNGRMGDWVGPSLMHGQGSCRGCAP